MDFNATPAHSKMAGNGRNRRVSDLPCAFIIGQVTHGESQRKIAQNQRGKDGPAPPQREAATPAPPQREAAKPEPKIGDIASGWRGPRNPLPTLRPTPTPPPPRYPVAFQGRPREEATTTGAKPLALDRYVRGDDDALVGRLVAASEGSNEDERDERNRELKCRVDEMVGQIHRPRGARKSDGMKILKRGSREELEMREPTATRAPAAPAKIDDRMAQLAGMGGQSEGQIEDYELAEKTRKMILGKY